MADDPGEIPATEIEDLLRQVQDDGVTPPPPNETDLPSASPHISQEELNGILGAAAAPESAAVATSAPPVAAPATDDIQLLLQQTQQALNSIDQPAENLVDGISQFRLQEFTGTPPSSEKASLDLLRDVELDVKIELGRTEMELEEVLKLQRGAVVTLDKLAGDFVDIYVNGRLIARGEVLVLNENFCVRVAELIEGDKVS